MIECGFNILPAEYMRDPSALNAMDSTEPFIFRLPIHCFVCMRKKFQLSISYVVFAALFLKSKVLLSIV